MKAKVRSDSVTAIFKDLPAVTVKSVYSGHVILRTPSESPVFPGK